MERWTDAKILKLIRLYSRFPNLWDRNEPSYDDLPSRYCSYSRILQGLCMPEHVTVSDVLSKLRELRKIYVSELRRMDVALKSGRICQPGVVWFDAMHCFLYGHLDADERLARSSNISIHSRGSSSQSWTTCSSQGMSQCCEKEEKAEIFQKNSSDQPRVQRGHIFFLRAPTNLRLTRMNTIYEIPKSQGTELDSEKKLDNSKCIQCNVICQESNRERKERRHVACRGTLRIKCRDKFRVENLDEDQLPSGVSKDDGRPYHEMSRVVCRNEGPSKCPYCEERKKDVQMNKVIEDCISAARKSLSNIRRQRPELDEHFISRTMQNESPENVVKCPKEVTKIICLGDDIEDHLSTILNDAKIKLCPVDITCNSDALRCSCCKTCSEPTKSIKLPKTFERERADSSQEVLEMARMELQDAGTLYNDSKFIRGSRDGLEVAEEINKEYDQFGTEVATVLKRTDRQRAIKLKELILETLQAKKSREMDNSSRLGNNAVSNVNSEEIRISAELKDPRYSPKLINQIQESEIGDVVPVLDSPRNMANSKEQLAEDLDLIGSFSHEMNRCDDRKIEGACTKDKWTDRKLRKLVFLYRKYPCLWQKDAKAYLDNSARHCAYRSIHNAMSPLECTFIEVMMKIRELRRMYVMELKKFLQAETMNRYYDSGCTWFHILHEFLYPYLDYDEAIELQDIPRILTSSNTQRGYNKRSDNEDSLNFSNTCVRTHKKINNDNLYNENFESKIGRYPESNIPKNIPAGNLRDSPTRIIACKTKKQEAQGPSPYYDSVEPRKSISLTILYDKKSEYYSKGGSSATDQELSWTAKSTYKKPNLSAVRKPSADEAEVKSRIEAEDEFDIFSRSVACQLKKMERNTALRAQMEIQKILTERLIGPQKATETAGTTSKILVPRKVDSRRYTNPPNSIIKRNQNERTNKNSLSPISTFKSTAAQFQQSLQRRPAEGNRSEGIRTRRGPITSVAPIRRDRK